MSAEATLDLFLANVRMFDGLAHSRSVLHPDSRRLLSRFERPCDGSCCASGQTGRL